MGSWASGGVRARVNDLVVVSLPVGEMGLVNVVWWESCDGGGSVGGGRWDGGGISFGGCCVLVTTAA